MKNKIIALSTLSLLTILSLGRTFTNVNAIDIADPSGWTYKYDYDVTSTRFELTTLSLGSNGTPVPYQQPVSNTFEAAFTQGYQINNDVVMPVGFYIKSQRTDSGTFTQNGVNWFPNGQTIGSNFSTPPAPQKIFLEFHNPNPINYQLGINITDSGSTAFWNWRYLPTSNVSIGAQPMEPDPALNQSATFTRSTVNIAYFYLPPYTSIIINSNATTTGSAYFRTFWIGEGSSPFVATYEEGFEAGQEVGYDLGFIDGADSTESDITWRISDLLSRVFNGVRNVFNIEIFDRLTLGTILAFPIAFTIFTFIFRLVRGGKA